jgi:hypothetical protein
MDEDDWLEMAYEDRYGDPDSDFDYDDEDDYEEEDEDG